MNYIYIIHNLVVLNKVIDLTITLQPGNENYNPIPCNLSETISYELNWQLVDITYVSTLPTIPGSNSSYDTTTILSLDFRKNEQEYLWSGTTKPFIGESRNYCYNKNILEEYIYSQSTTGDLFDDNDRYILYCSSFNGNQQGPVETSVNGTLRLLARDTVNVGSGPTSLHEIVAEIGVQANGYINNFQQEQTFINILSNNVCEPGFSLIKSIKLSRDAFSNFVEYYVYIEINQQVTTKFELDIQLYNNDKNIEQLRTNFTRFWTINKRSANNISNTTLLKEVSTEIPNTNIVTGPSTIFNNGAVFVNKLIPNGTGKPSSFITEETDIIDNSIKNNILLDGSSNIINKTTSGGLVIDAKSNNNTGAGLKIFNSGGTYSGSLAYPQISLIPYKNSGGANTLGNPTIISANDDESTIFQGSGNLTIRNGIQNFGTFNIWQGNGTTSLGSNIISSSQYNNGYRLSLNHSRNDTDVVINTPGYNIHDSPNNPAMIVDSGLDNITFHAPVNFENQVDLGDNVTIGGNNIAVYEEYSFDTNSLSPGDWFTLVKSGTGQDKNKLRSDALFILEDRLGSHHHCITFRAGAKFSSGVYINVIESSWFSSARIKALRIAYESTYDGSVLQAQLNTNSGSVSTSLMTLRIYQNRNDEGWKIFQGTSSPSSDANPVVYVSNSSSGLGTQYTKFRYSGDIIYNPSNNNRRTVQTTTNHVIINEANLKLDGGIGNFYMNGNNFNVDVSTVIINASQGIELEANSNSTQNTEYITFRANTNEGYFYPNGFNSNKFEGMAFDRKNPDTTILNFQRIEFGMNDSNKKAHTRMLEPFLFKNKISFSDATSYLNSLTGGISESNRANYEGAIIYACENQAPANNRACSRNVHIFGGGRREPAYLSAPMCKKTSIYAKFSDPNVFSTSSYIQELNHFARYNSDSVTTSNTNKIFIIRGSEDITLLSEEHNNPLTHQDIIFAGNGFLDRIVIYPWGLSVKLTATLSLQTVVIDFQIWMCNCTYLNNITTNNTSVTSNSILLYNFTKTWTPVGTGTSTTFSPFIKSGNGNYLNQEGFVCKSNQKLRIDEDVKYNIFMRIAQASGPPVQISFEKPYPLSEIMNSIPTKWNNKCMTFDLYAQLHCTV